MNIIPQSERCFQINHSIQYEKLVSSPSSQQAFAGTRKKLPAIYREASVFHIMADALLRFEP